MIDYQQTLSSFGLVKIVEPSCNSSRNICKNCANKSNSCGCFVCELTQRIVEENETCDRFQDAKKVNHFEKCESCVNKTETGCKFNRHPAGCNIFESKPKRDYANNRIVLDNGWYSWRRITDLEAGCGLCELLQFGQCKGTRAGKPCVAYTCRSDAGSNTCRYCKKLGGRLPHQQGGEDMYYCTEFCSTVSLNDYGCFRIKE